ncbi:MAG: peroxide stress protein YaaA [Parvularculaceae bacterium]
MLVLLSPAKNLNFDPVPAAPAATKPALLKEAAALAGTAKTLTPAKIGKLMGVSAKLAELNYARFQAFRADNKGETKQAALAFNGDVYLGLNAKTMSKDDFAFAQEHLRILSGLYGLLRPLDAIQPYRLEMGSALTNARGKDLYAYWGDVLATEIDKTVNGHDDPTIVNLASHEYFNAVDAKALKAPVVAASFLDEKGGKLRSLQFFAKKARGWMARWIIDNRVDRRADLKNFKAEGYAYRAGASTETHLVFTRPQPPLKAV